MIRKNLSGSFATLRMTNLGQILFLTWIIGIYIFAWIIQDKLFLSYDVSQLLHAAKLLLAGGTYVNDFFNPNPPLISYLYAPPIIISQLLNIKIIIPFRIYIFFLVTLSASLCYLQLSQLLSKQNLFFTRAFLITFLFMTLIFPLHDIGQREHLLVILTMPYLLLVSNRLSNHEPNKKEAACIGFLAILGFAIKPQFLLTPLLVELYYALSKKNIFSWIRTETLVMLALLSIYGLVMFIFYHDFIFTILPYLFRVYYKSISDPWSHLFLNPDALFCWVPFLFAFLLYKNNSLKQLQSVLLLALGGFLFAYYAQRTTFSYHLLPAMIISTLLLVMQFFSFVINQKITARGYILVLSGCVLIISTMYFTLNYMWAIILFYPKTFFIYCAFLFSILTYLIQVKKNIFYIVLTVSIILAVGGLCAYFSVRLPWYAYQLFIVLFALIASFVIISPKSQAPIKLMITSFFGVLLFAIPALALQNQYMACIHYKKTILNPMIAFMNQQPKTRQSIYMLAQSTMLASPMIDYTNAQYVERFDCMWIAHLLIKHLAKDGDDLLRYNIKHNPDIQFFMNMTAQDFQKNKPAIVFVATREWVANKNGKSLYFDYIRYFSENENFRREWQQYRYLTTLREHLYLDVYIRKS